MLKALAVLGVSLPLAWAQSGTVQSEGQPIPGVAIRATLGERALSTVSDGNGAFEFQGMTPGTWTFEADMFGFEHLKRNVEITAAPTKIVLTLQLQARREVTQRGPAGQEGGASLEQPPLDLSAEAPPELALQNAGTANDSFMIDGTVSNGLETNNRDFGGGPGGFGGPGFGLGGGPGAGGPGALDQGGAPGGPGGAAGPGAGGGPGGGGGRGGRGLGGGGFGGRGGGGGRGGRRGQARGLIGNRSRQGANQIRINVFDTVTDSAFDAKNYAINGQETPKPQSQSNKYGLNIGGPVIIPHLFDLSKQLNFTVNYNGTIQTLARNNFSTVPTTAEQQGNFSGSSPIYDPLSGGTSPFPNNQIPLTRLDPIALALEQQFIPLPNQSGSANKVNNYQFVAAPPNNMQQVSARLQYTVSSKDRLSIQSQTQYRDTKSPQNLGFIDTTTGFGQNQSVSWTHNFAARLFNTFQVGLNRNTSLGTPYFETLGKNVAADLGIAGTWPDPSNYGPPSLSFGSGFTGLSDGTPAKTAVQVMSLQNALSWRRGKHNLQFGGLFGRLDQNYVTDANGRGSFSFTGAATQEMVNGLAVNGTGNGYADFLLGLPQTDSVTWGAARYYRQINYSSWANDDYRVFSNLSLQLGVRYEYTSPTSEKYGRLANLDLAPGFSGINSIVTAASVSQCISEQTGVPCVPSGTTGLGSALIQAQHGAIEPRIGLAWQAMKRGSLLIRAGYGIYYNEGVYNQISQNLGLQPQFVTTSGTLQTSSTNVLTLANGLTMIPASTSVSNTYAYDPNYKLPYSQTWNLGIQRSLPGRLVLQINYTGVRGTHLNLGFDPNQATPGPVGQWETRIPISYAGLFTYNEAGANLISNTEQVSLIRRMRSNVSFQFAYTLAKSMDDNVTTALNPLDLQAEWANSPNVRNDQVSFTFLVESPVDQRNGFLANKGVLTKILKNWTLQVPITWGTGLPLTATVFGDVAGIGTTATERAEATGLPVTSGSGYFNLAAFTTPAAGTFGNAGRDTIPGPDTFSMNANLSRTIQLKERKTLEFQINSTNILNHPVPTSFGTVVNESSTYGVLSAVNAMRVVSGTIRFRM